MRATMTHMALCTGCPVPNTPKHTSSNGDCRWHNPNQQRHHHRMIQRAQARASIDLRKHAMHFERHGSKRRSGSKGLCIRGNKTAARKTCYSTYALCCPGVARSTHCYSRPAYYRRGTKTACPIRRPCPPSWRWHTPSVRAYDLLRCVSVPFPHGISEPPHPPLVVRSFVRVSSI